MTREVAGFSPAAQAELYRSFGLGEVQAAYAADDGPTHHTYRFGKDTLHAYPFTTENMSEYMPKLDLRDAEVAAICGSNDFTINAFQRGATSVDAIDAMPTAVMYGELKLAGLAEFGRDEFLQFFNDPWDPNYLSPGQYQHLRPGLSWQSKRFFDQLLARQPGTRFKNSGFFIDKIQRPDQYIAMNPYLRDADNYADAQSKIGKTRLIPSDFGSFLALAPDRSYDAIYASNIFAYMSPEASDEVMRQATRCLRIGGSILRFSFFYPDDDVTQKIGQLERRAEKLGLEHTSISGTVPHMDYEEPGDSGYSSLLSVMKKVA